MFYCDVEQNSAKQHYSYFVLLRKKKKKRRRDTNSSLIQVELSFELITFFYCDVEQNSAKQHYTYFALLRKQKEKKTRTEMRYELRYSEACLDDECSCHADHVFDSRQIVTQLVFFYDGLLRRFGVTRLFVSIVAKVVVVVVIVVVVVVLLLFLLLLLLLLFYCRCCCRCLLFLWCVFCVFWFYF